ncbi:MAG: hypothetical protein COA95_07505 [Methylophaga sp.]|nr:MAG: hypothetical protein COA95_07505 [Methylophaga sp.]
MNDILNEFNPAISQGVLYFYIKVFILILNDDFLASAKTLIEHTRIFMDKYYSDSPIHQAYSQKIKDDLANDEPCRFVQDLRNYMLH